MQVIICVDFFEGTLDLSAARLIIGDISLSGDIMYADIYAIESVASALQLLLTVEYLIK